MQINDKILSLQNKMEKILAPIKQRILQFIDFKNFERLKFFKNLNISASNFRGQGVYSEVGGEVIAKILAEYSELDAEWLLTGKGNMLKSEVKKEPVQKVQPATANNDKYISMLESNIALFQEKEALYKENKALLEEKISKLEAEIQALRATPNSGQAIQSQPATQPHIR